MAIFESMTSLAIALFNRPITATRVDKALQFVKTPADLDLLCQHLPLAAPLIRERAALKGLG